MVRRSGPVRSFDPQHEPGTHACRQHPRGQRDVEHIRHVYEHGVAPDQGDVDTPLGEDAGERVTEQPVFDADHDPEWGGAVWAHGDSLRATEGGVIVQMQEPSHTIRAGEVPVSIRVMLVEDHQMLAQSLAMMLEQRGLDVVRPPHLDPESVLRTAQEHDPSIAVVDLHLEDGGTPLSLIPALVERETGVVIITGDTDRRRLAECMEAGALGIVSKSEPFDHLVDAVVEAAELRRTLFPTQRAELMSELRAHRREDRERLSPFEELTPREKEVLAALMEGKSNETIATEAHVSVLTIRSQVSAVLQKLGVNSKLAAVVKAYTSRWTPPVTDR